MAIVLFYVFFFILLFMCLLMVATAYVLARSKRKTSTLLTYSLKVLSVYGLFVNTVLFLPTIQMFISTVICSDSLGIGKNGQCYTGFYFFHFAVGIIGIILSIIVSLTFTLLYIELNPYSKIPFAEPQSKLNLGRLLLKIVIVLYFSLDTNVTPLHMTSAPSN